METRIDTLSWSLRERGIDTEETVTICNFVAYIDGVDAIDEALLDTDLPLAYEPAMGVDGEDKG